jgi:nitroimidazol reductase NimA-like FMN-containing flavoprotein (pyridoxamine 5'-phosphate oxidase superfamily)
MLAEIKNLAMRKNICVLATLAGNKPYCSLMAYTMDDACSEVYMATHRNSQKFRNLTENPAVSLLIDTREVTPFSQAQALTIEGTCGLIDDDSKKKKVLERLLAVHPHLKEFCAHPQSEILCIRITAFLLLKGLTEAYHVNLKSVDPLIR